jgi:hypothetical protein
MLEGYPRGSRTQVDRDQAIRHAKKSAVPCCGKGREAGRRADLKILGFEHILSAFSKYAAHLLAGAERVCQGGV